MDRDLFGGTLPPSPRRSGSGPTDAWRVLDFIRSQGDRGATDDEIEVALGLPHQTASARRRDLEKGGQIYNTSARRRTRTGTPAAVWRVRPTEHG